MTVASNPPKLSPNSALPSEKYCCFSRTISILVKVFHEQLCKAFLLFEIGSYLLSLCICKLRTMSSWPFQHQSAELCAVRPAEALRTLHAISRDWVLNVGAVLGKHPASCSWCVTSSGGFGTVLGAAHCTISWAGLGTGACDAPSGGWGSGTVQARCAYNLGIGAARATRLAARVGTAGPTFLLFSY